MHVLETIERHLRATGTRPSRFGRDAVGDPHLVADMRHGREVRPTMARRILAHIARREAAGDA